MGQYRNQAKRVIDHIASQCKITVEDVAKVFNITVDQIERKIIEMVKSGLNGKQAADAIIKLWEASAPTTLTIDGNTIQVRKQGPYPDPSMSGDLIIPENYHEKSETD